MRLASRVLPAAPITLPIAGGPLRGKLFRADFSRRPQYLLGTYERPATRAICEWLRPGQVGYDIGANIGYMALVMARAVGPAGCVVAFEPSPHAFALLSVNATRSRALHVDARQLALADVEGEETFSDFDYDLVSRFGDHSADYPDARVLTVCVTTLDRVIASSALRPPDFVKIDVEGAEMRVLRGMQDTLHRYRPLLLLELHEREVEEEVMAWLPARGYRPVSLTSGAPRQVLFTPRERACEAVLAATDGVMRYSTDSDCGPVDGSRYPAVATMSARRNKPAALGGLRQRGN